MTDLVNYYPAQIYPNWLTIEGTGEGIDATLRLVQGGNGVSTTMSLSLTKVDFNVTSGNEFTINDNFIINENAWEILSSFDSDTPIFFNVSGSLGLPVGTTGQRPGIINSGQIRFNSDTNKLEYFNGTIWKTVATE